MKTSTLGVIFCITILLTRTCLFICFYFIYQMLLCAYIVICIELHCPCYSLPITCPDTFRLSEGVNDSKIDYMLQRIKHYCSLTNMLRLKDFMYEYIPMHFVMVPLNLTYLYCLQHSFFEHLFNLYIVFIFMVKKTHTVHEYNR